MKEARIIFAILFFILFLNVVSSLKVNVISPKEDNKIKLNNFCDVDWKCSAWGDCVKGTKKRVCFDKNNCESKYNQPLTETLCKEENSKEVIDFKARFYIFGFFVITLLIIILVLFLINS